MSPQNLFLIGPMGAGKSAVGRQLAKLLHHENYYEGTKNIELNGRMAEMAQLSVSGLESKGVDVRHFENLNF